MKKLFLTSLYILAGLVFAQAQMVDMHWDTHGVGFKVPANFTIEINNAEEFAANNDFLMLSIVPVQEIALTKENMAEAVLAMAEGMGYETIDKVAEADVDDFTGYYIKGTKEGINAVVMAMLDTESSTNLLVVIVYHDEHWSEAQTIANSFYAYD